MAEETAAVLGVLATTKMVEGFASSLVSKGCAVVETAAETVRSNNDVRHIFGKVDYSKSLIRIMLVRNDSYLSTKPFILDIKFGEAKELSSFLEEHWIKFVVSQFLGKPLKRKYLDKGSSKTNVLKITKSLLVSLSSGGLGQDVFLSRLGHLVNWFKCFDVDVKLGDMFYGTDKPPSDFYDARATMFIRKGISNWVFVGNPGKKE